MIKKIIKFISKPKENYANWAIFKYHFLKAIKKFLAKYGLIKNIDLKKTDMFEWSLYNIHYRGELQKDSKIWTLKLNHGDYEFTNSELKQTNTKIKPLHYNWRLIYETILQLNPISVLELGCGNGMHLHNINVLASKIKLFGVDREPKQIAFLHESYPNLPADIRLADATIPWSSDMPKTELSFTQAVIMHIRTGDSHKTALANLFNSATKYILLMEKFKNHQFMDDIKDLHNKKIIKWEKIFFYYRVSEVTKKPHLMICSSEPLNYPIIENYKIMLNQ